MSGVGAASASPFRQPKGAWAAAYADLTSPLLRHARYAVHVIAPDPDRAGQWARERIR